MHSLCVPYLTGVNNTLRVSMCARSLRHGRHARQPRSISRGGTGSAAAARYDEYAAPLCSTVQKRYLARENEKLLERPKLGREKRPTGGRRFSPRRSSRRRHMPDAPAEPAGVRGEETSRRRIFTEFMTGVARFEELVDGGRRFLARFRQELEYFKRPPVPTGSDVMSEIVGSNCTGRMKSYLEAGCGLHCRNISNLNQLNACEGELEEHINKVSVLLKELQCLVEAAYDSIITANLSAIEVPDDRTADSKMNDESQLMEKKEQLADQLDADSSLVTVMILVHNMLKLDYLMQEKIVRSLSLKSSSTELESYCLMWDLRPYIDDNVTDLAWRLCT